MSSILYILMIILHVMLAIECGGKKKKKKDLKSKKETKKEKSADVEEVPSASPKPAPNKGQFRPGDDMETVANVKSNWGVVQSDDDNKKKPLYHIE